MSNIHVDEYDGNVRNCFHANDTTGQFGPAC